VGSTSSQKKRRNTEGVSTMQHTTHSRNRPNRGSRIARLAAGLAIAATLTGSLQGVSTQAAAAHGRARDTTGATTGDCPASSSSAAQWPALNDPSFGLVAPGQSGSATETFVASSSGQLSATVTAGADVFHVTGVEVYKQSRVRVPVTPPTGELPEGYKPPSQHWIYRTECTLVAQSDGSAPQAVGSNQLITIDLAANPAQGDASPSGTLSLALDGDPIALPLSLTVGGINASLDAGAVMVAAGRSTAIPVTVTSLGGGDTDATFTLYDPDYNSYTQVPGISVAPTVVHVPAGQTVHAVLPVAVSRGADAGTYRYNVAVSAYGGLQEFAVDSLSLTVTALPTQSVSIPLGAVVTAWESLRTPACAVINDLTGKEVLAHTGRTIRNPDCYVAPLQLKATQTGDSLQLVASAPGNWESFYATTPDGIPGDLDPKFTVNYDVTFTLTIDLPSTLDGSTPLRVTELDPAILNVSLDSHNLTGDLVEAVAKTFGYGQNFHPANYGLADSMKSVRAAVNAALSTLTTALGSAPKQGYTLVDFSLDPTTQVLTATIS
jgi:hypothetical protein